MATTLITVGCKLFHMMPNIIILKVRKVHQPTASRFSTAKNKPVGGGHNVPPPPSLNRVKAYNFIDQVHNFSQTAHQVAFILMVR